MSLADEMKGRVAKYADRREDWTVFGFETRLDKKYGRSQRRYIGASGFNLVATVQRGDRRLIGVVFGGRSGRSRDRHMMKLLDRAFAALEVQRPRTASLPPLPQRKPIRIATDGPRRIALAGTKPALPALPADLLREYPYLAGLSGAAASPASNGTPSRQATDTPAVCGAHLPFFPPRV